MGQPEHLAVLKSGSAVWNQWRMDNPGVVPDLRGAHFKEGRFSRANLAGADLTLAYFGRADLTGADLTGANLSDASLRRANLSKANLFEAKVLSADLTRADFFGARLESADLSGAYLEGANFTRANLDGARLVGSDLRLAIAVDATFSPRRSHRLPGLRRLSLEYGYGWRPAERSRHHPIRREPRHDR
jgi:hypothetical protein